MNISINNLDYATSERQIDDLFSTFGEVRAVVILKDYDNKSAKAMVQMKYPNDALKASQALNGYNFGGNILDVTLEKRERVL